MMESYLNAIKQKPTKTTGLLIPFIWHFFKPHKLGMSILLGIALMWSLDMTIRPYMLKLMIDKVTDNPNHPDIISLLYFPVLGYIGILIFINVSFRVWDYIWLKTLPLIKADIAEKVIKYLGFHSHEYFQNTFAGNLANKIFNLDHDIEQIIKLIINGFFPHILALIVSGFAITWINPLFSIVIFIWAVIFSIISILVIKRAKYLTRILSESKSQFMGKVVDSINNITNIRLFDRNDHEIFIVKEQLKDVVLKDQKAQKYRLLIQTFQGGAIVLLVSVLIYLLIYLKQLNLITVGDFALIMTLSFSISDSIRMLSIDYVNFSIYIGNCNQALSIINQPHAIKDNPNAHQLIIKEGRIDFENVNFGYNKCLKLFHNQSVQIPGKQKVGLVGYSGSGKSTFVNLIIRLFDIESGKILIDRQNIKEVTQGSLRKNISFIPQDPILFHRSLMENIRYGKIDATDEEVIEAAKKAHAHEFIITLPDGYNSLVGERGIKLSSGQKQRIAIARAILKNAPILILDEATSSLDSVTEQLIQDSLTVLMANKTVLVIAHRLSTLLSLDRILVFDQGNIIEDGKHNELLVKDGLYTTLWNFQRGEFLLDNSFLLI